MSKNQEEALKIAQDILSDKENRPDIDTLMLSQEVVAQAQTIARLEAGDEQRVRDISRLIIERDEARAELAASREMGPCGHPKSCWNEGYSLTHKRGDNLGLPKVLAHCRFCAELAASRADALEWVENLCHEKYEDEQSEVAMNAYLIIRDAVHERNTSADAAALAERDRRIRLEEAEWWHRKNTIIEHSCEREVELANKGYLRNPDCKRIIELRAPIPAERAGDAVTPTSGHGILSKAMEVLERNYAVCPTCKGNKEIFLPSGPHPNALTARCPTCNGNGETFTIANGIDKCSLCNGTGRAVQGFCAQCSSCGGCTKDHIHCRKCECGTGRASK